MAVHKEQSNLTYMYIVGAVTRKACETLISVSVADLLCSESSGNEFFFVLLAELAECSHGYRKDDNRVNDSLISLNLITCTQITL